MRVFYLICLITIKKRLKPYKSFIYTNICFEWILHISDKKDEVLKTAEKTKKALTEWIIYYYIRKKDLPRICDKIFL